MMNKYFTFQNNQFEIPKDKVLIFQNRGVNSIDDLKGLSDFNDLISITLSINEITEITDLETFTELSYLDLRRNKIRKITGLNNLRKLRTLYLQRNQIEKIENLESLENLEVLDLSENNIKKIENLEYLKNLKKLNLGINKISRIENLDQLPQLEELRLTRNSKINKIENLNKLKNLKFLSLKGLPLKKIEGLSALLKLEDLIIQVDNIPGVLDQIEGLEHLINLRYVDIDTFHLCKKEIPLWVNVVILRFACMVKAKNYEIISDWKKIFTQFPKAFKKFKIANSELKVQWYIQQCSQNLLKVIELILNTSKFKSIRKNQEMEWNEIYNYGKKILSHNFPKRTLEVVLKQENHSNKFSDL
ncbi:MAG: leucine-rich repeat protein [Promethearchaeota archaeon]